MYFFLTLFAMLTYAMHDGDTEGRSSHDHDNGPEWCLPSCNKCHELCLEEDNQQKRLPKRIAGISYDRPRVINQKSWNGCSKWHQNHLFEAIPASHYVSSSCNARTKHLKLTIIFVTLLIVMLLISAIATFGCMYYRWKLQFERQYNTNIPLHLEDLVAHRKESAMNGFELESNNCEETSLQHFDAFISYSPDDEELVRSLIKQLHPRNLTDCSPQHVQNQLPNNFQTVEYLRKQLYSATSGEALLKWASEDEGLLIGEIEVILELSPKHSSNGKFIRTVNIFRDPTKLAQLISFILVQGRSSLEKSVTIACSKILSALCK